MKHPGHTTKSGIKIVIEEASIGDASTLVAYVERISGESDFLSFGPGEFGVTVEEEKGILEDYRLSAHKLYLVARIDDDIVGTLTFDAGHRPRMAHCGGIGMSVRRDFWSEGIGSLLIDELIRRSVANGVVKKINLLVRTDNDRAIGLYRKKGFLIEGTITKDTCVNGRYFDHHLMGLFLTDSA